MLAWATNIHKVQGMQFDQLQVDFELGYGDGSNEFYEGMAYMALSRANVVQIIGRIHLKLLNNVNIKNLQWWENELKNWKSFKSGNVSKIVFRNNVHQSNHTSATLSHRYLIVARDSHPSCQGFDIDVDDAPTTNRVHAVPAPAPALASAPHNSLGSALTFAPAPPKKRQTNASDTAHYKQPGLPLAPAPAATLVPAQKRQNTTLPAVAAAQATAPAPALGLALDTDNVVNPAPKAGARSTAAFLSVIESDEEFELVVMPPASTSSATPAHLTNVAAQKEVPAPNPGLAPVSDSALEAAAPSPSALSKRKHSAPAPGPVPDPVPVPALALSRVSDPAPPPLASAPASKRARIIVKNFVTKAFNKKANDFPDKFNASLQDLAALLFKAKTDVQVPPLFRCKHQGHVDTYGEVTPKLIKVMIKQYQRLVNVQKEKDSTFVDLGSGHGGLVCLIASLRKFNACFGVENEANRASWACPLAENFLAKLRCRSMKYSNIQINFGDFFQCHQTLDFLKRASLVWVNNVAFTEINFRLLQLLDRTVPVGCVVVSFVSFLTDRMNETGFESISETVVEEAGDWTFTPLTMHVMQKKS
jgi:hypothetical protein